jgi:hypothetical protein
VPQARATYYTFPNSSVNTLAEKCSNSESETGPAKNLSANITNERIARIFPKITGEIRQIRGIRIKKRLPKNYILPYLVLPELRNGK